MTRTTILKKETRNLPCVLTESERAERGAALGHKLREIFEAEEKETERRKAEKLRIEKLQNEARHLGGVTAAGQEYRDVVVEVVADHTNNRVDTVRVDTGEVISTRDIRPEERQISLLEAPDEEAAPAVE